jgi:polygalacturonase
MLFKYTNNDGIDPEYVKDVLIENIDFDNKKDNITDKQAEIMKEEQQSETSE